MIIVNASHQEVNSPNRLTEFHRGRKSFPNEAPWVLARKADADAREEANNSKVEGYLSSLTNEERERIETEAVKNNPFKMTRVGSAFRAAIIQEHVLKLLEILENETED